MAERGLRKTHFLLEDSLLHEQQWPAGAAIATRSFHSAFLKIIEKEENANHLRKNALDVPATMAGLMALPTCAAQMNETFFFTFGKADAALAGGELHCFFPFARMQDTPWKLSLFAARSEATVNATLAGARISRPLSDPRRFQGTALRAIIDP